MLKGMSDGEFSLQERQSAEELLAVIAEKSGDMDAALIARARARLIARKRAVTGIQP